MPWLGKKENFFTNLGTRIRKSKTSYLTPHHRIPILIHTIHVTQASTQTLPINWNNNNAEDTKSNRSRRCHYRYRFNKCLAELIEKYPPIPAQEYLKEENSHQSSYSSILNNDEITSDLWSKLLQSRENLSKLNQILEDLDQRLDSLCSPNFTTDI